MVLKSGICAVVVLLTVVGPGSAVTTTLNPLPSHTFIHQETFDSATAAGWNLNPSFVPYPHAPAWKVPQPSTIVDGHLTPAAPGEGGAAMFDVISIIDPDVSIFGLNLGGEGSSYAIYMRLTEWDNTSKDVAVTLGFMNFAAEGAAPDPEYARYVSGYVRNKRSTAAGDMVSWGGKSDMDNPADGTDPGLSATLDPTGTWDYAFLFEGNGTSIVASAFVKATDTAEWTRIMSGDATSVDTGLNFYSRNIFLWSRYSEGWAIEEFAVSRIPEPATLTLLGLGGMLLLKRRK
ncbi:MAG: PEP-CTERM sorting domain-containing protein [Phycisphaerae bacterium]|nr:PEP-CTERM sorting domain-containing protein [Phycisphaerae bacterium]